MAGASAIAVQLKRRKHPLDGLVISAYVAVAMETQPTSAAGTGTAPKLTGEDLRQAMLERVSAHSSRVKKSLTTLGIEIKGDKDFFHRVKRGGNFTVRSFDEVMNVLDEREAELNGKELGGGEANG